MKNHKTLVAAGALCLAVASASSASTEFNDSGMVTIGLPTVSLKPSQNVIVRYLPSTITVISGAGVISFSLSAFHSSGTKLFATSSANAKIFTKDAASIADPPAAPDAGASADFSGYTVL